MPVKKSIEREIKAKGSRKEATPIKSSKCFKEPSYDIHDKEQQKIMNKATDFSREKKFLLLDKFGIGSISEETGEFMNNDELDGMINEIARSISARKFADMVNETQSPKSNRSRNDLKESISMR